MSKSVLQEPVQDHKKHSDDYELKFIHKSMEKLNRTNLHLII